MTHNVETIAELHTQAYTTAAVMIEYYIGNGGSEPGLKWHLKWYVESYIVFTCKL